MTHVVHLTTVHSPHDPRILHKECATLADVGYDVTLIVPADQDETRRGVRIRSIARPRNRWERISLTALRLYRAARREAARVYHVHDPELIPVGLLLQMRGNRVVYDVHEDYTAAARQKEHVPAWARPLLVRMFAVLEGLAGRRFDLVLAERCYARRFPRGTLVLNYPRLERFTQLQSTTLVPGNGRPQLLYAGCVTEDRGALQHARLLGVRDDVELHVIGRCKPELAGRMRAAAGSGADRLHIVGEGEWVPYERILEAYGSRHWTAALAVFPDTPHYREKELTKLFEYMAAGIPIICSRFPVWASLVQSARCGICIDPEDTEALSGAVEFLLRDSATGARMAEAGRRAVRERYSWESQAENLIRLYASLTDSLEAAPPSP